jgi:hypothetical protein
MPVEAGEGIATTEQVDRRLRNTKASRSQILPPTFSVIIIGQNVRVQILKNHILVPL